MVARGAAAGGRPWARRSSCSWRESKKRGGEKGRMSKGVVAGGAAAGGRPWARRSSCSWRESKKRGGEKGRMSNKKVNLDKQAESKGSISQREGEREREREKERDREKERERGALNVARGNYQPPGVVQDVEYQPASLSEAALRAHRLVGEIIEHCDEISRGASAGGGEEAERQRRARRTLQRMESWPTRQVRPRHAGEGHLVDRERRREAGQGRV